MKDCLISSYIDDEMGLSEKIEFVEAIHAQEAYKRDAVDLLYQEKLLRADVIDRMLAFAPVPKRRFSISAWWRPAGVFASGLAAALLLFFILTPRHELPGLKTHRFVLYQPDAAQVEITGSFIGWEAVPMKKSGSSGYWEAVLDVPAGEHRLCYILEGGRRIPDPTIPIREKDDFGGENSILTVGI